MRIECPNINLPEWKKLVKEVGEDAAHLAFHRMNADKPADQMADIPTPEQAKELLLNARREAMIAKYSRQASPGGVTGAKLGETPNEVPEEEKGVLPPADPKKPWRERLARMVQSARDMAGLDPTPNMTRAGIKTEQFEHASARFYAQRLVQDLLAKVFPTAYGDRKTMGRYMDILNKNNILGGYDKLKVEAEDARALADKAITNNEKNAESLSKKADEAEQLVMNVEEAHDLDAYEREMQAARKDPEIMAAAKAWNENVVPHMDQLYNEMKGMDPNTEREGRGRHSELGERVNLLPMNKAVELAQWSNQDKPLPEITTSNYRNPNVKRDPFAKKAKLTGKYATDAELILLNSLGGRINEVTKLRMFKAIEDNGVGKIMDAGDAAPKTIKGEPVTRLAVKMPETGPDGRTRMVEKSLFIQRSLAPEVRSILNTDMKLPQHPIASFVTQLQLMQLADMASHLKNLHSVIVNALGRKSVMRDLINRVPFLSSVNAMREIWNVAHEVSSDTPAIRAEIAEMAKMGMIRPSYPSTGIQKVTHGQQIIHAVDTAARIIMNRRFTELVKRKWIKTDDLRARRDFVNQIGEYNRRLMGRWMQAARDSGIAPFIVAGRTFNKFARRLVTGDPGFETASGSVEVKARALQISTLAVAATIPALFNIFTTGTIWGRTTTPIGAIDLGPENDTEDGKHRIIDLFHLIGIRRGLRALGINAVMQGLKQDKTVNDMAGDAISDVVTTAAHPWMGPGIGFAFKTLTGRRLDLRQNVYPEAAKIGDEKVTGAAKYGAFAWSGLKEQNPFLHGIASMFSKGSAAEAGKDIASGAFKSPLRAIGYNEIPAEPKGASAPAASHSTRPLVPAPYRPAQYRPPKPYRPPRQQRGLVPPPANSNE